MTWFISPRTWPRLQGWARGFLTQGCLRLYSLCWLWPQIQVTGKQSVTFLSYGWKVMGILNLHTKETAQILLIIFVIFFTTDFLNDSLFELHFQSGGFYKLLLFNNQIFENITTFVPLSIQIQYNANKSRWPYLELVLWGLKETSCNNSRAMIWAWTIVVEVDIIQSVTEKKARYLEIKSAESADWWIWGVAVKERVRERPPG